MSALISTIIVLLTPYALKGVGNILKSIEAVRLAPDKAFLVRGALALLSLMIAVGHAMLTEQPVPDTAVQAFVDALGVFAEALVYFLSATGAYYFQKRSRR